MFSLFKKKKLEPIDQFNANDVSQGGIKVQKKNATRLVGRWAIYDEDNRGALLFLFTLLIGISVVIFIFRQP